MYDIILKRVKGSGKGIEIGFPTVNSNIDELPQGVSIGLYATCINYYIKSLTLISKNRTGGYRLETHSFNGCNVGVDASYNLFLFKKLRDHKNFRNREKQIIIDKTLVNEFFKDVNTCFECEFFCHQDYGYSNYTVTDTDYSCLLGVFTDIPNPSYTDTYKYANTCNGFVKGENWYFDVDGESDRPSDDYIKRIHRTYNIKKILSDEI